MALDIETFSNAKGGNAFYKAVTHPLAAEPARALVERLRAGGPVAVYDPHGLLPAFDALYPLDGVKLSGFFVQDASALGRVFRGTQARSLAELAACDDVTLLIADFDTAKTAEHLQPLLREGVEVVSFDVLRLPDEMLSDTTRYLSTLNFATNFVFFRDADGQHTRLVTANYWSGYGAKDGRIWCRLFDEAGVGIAEWNEPLPAANAAIVIDSAEVRARFKLPEFTGQLFVHVVGAKGHDMLKYALDTYGDADDVLSCTHDANSWPSNLYAGLPAPDDGETVALWVQNSHPFAIGPSEIGLNATGDERVAWLKQPIGPFATHRLDVAALLPDLRWPQQIEIRSGKHFVRPRYEIAKKNGRVRIAHPNVEREDLRPDPLLPKLQDHWGKGFILPAPVLPLGRYRSTLLPTPMSTAQTHLPIALTIYTKDGAKAAEHRFGNVARGAMSALAANEILNGALDGGYGHMELTYDFEAGDEADGWLHALFRYEDMASGHAAETSFGAHVFNTLATYKGEPQSYKGPPPGLSTRLFLRLGRSPHDTLCHLIYPASQPWQAESDTQLILMAESGAEVARRAVAIPCGGSLLWRANEMFDAEARFAAGMNGYAIVRDTTCRLFGYHGVLSARAFSLDHMFGF